MIVSDSLPPPRPQNSSVPPNPEGILYFCMPFNDKILNYWDIVEARLSHVRNCRNIDGIRRKLPLMDAPIDPELLIRATAVGLDLSEVIAGLYAPPPHYRYNILSARAAELTSEAKALGAAMLSAIEKRDAEQLAQLRSSNEISLLKLVREVRTLQITEAERNIEALRASRRSVASRYGQYQRLIGKKDIKVPGEHKTTGEESMLGSVGSALASNRSNLGLIKEENEQYVGFEEASGWSTPAGVAKTASGVAHLLAAPLFPSIVTEGGGKVATATAYADPPRRLLLPDHGHRTQLRGGRRLAAAPIGGVRVDAALHAPMGSLPWTGPNAANRLAARAMWAYSVDFKQVAPNYVYRAHNHRYSDSGSNYECRAILLPCWSLITVFGYRMGHKLVLADIGGTINGELIRYRGKVGRIWALKI